MNKETRNRMVILLVSPPGDLQISLQALVNAHLTTDLLVIGEADSVINIIVRHNPKLIIIDQEITRESVSDLVNEIKSKRPDILCIVLLNDDDDQQKIIDAGADLAVVKGLKGSKLIAMVKDLLC